MVLLQYSKDTLSFWEPKENWTILGVCCISGEPLINTVNIVLHSNCGQHSPQTFGGPGLTIVFPRYQSPDAEPQKTQRYRGQEVSTRFSFLSNARFSTQYYQEIYTILHKVVKMGSIKRPPPPPHTHTPAPIDLLSVFLILQIRVYSSSSTFDSIIVGVAWAHKRMGLTSPTSHPLIMQLINADHRILGRAL